MVSLDLSFSELSGPLPPVLMYLTQLKSINLAYNSFSGTLPRAWALWGASIQEVYLQVRSALLRTCL